MRIVYIHGPAGSGKTRNAAALAKHYGCKHIADNGDWTKAGLRQAGRNGGVLVLSIEWSTDGISVPIAAALRAAGIRSAIVA